ncbi:MAG: EamA family transporter [Gordonibacter sp.]|uniref:EamA family transporter n=1 Tax=Gordonibacter sp. TaxID=1968902 RepID=UPI002FC66EA7
MPFAEMLPFIGIGAFGVFISSIAQVFLKKEALREHGSFLKEYVNPLVIGGYVLMLISTLLLVIAFKGIPLSMGPILEATSYVYVTVFGVVLFKEKLGKKKVAALAVIMLGIMVYSFGL